MQNAVHGRNSQLETSIVITNLSCVRGERY